MTFRGHIYVLFRTIYDVFAFIRHINLRVFYNVIE